MTLYKTYFKNPENPRCIGIYLFITFCIDSFQTTTVVANGLSNFHQMIATACKPSFPKSKPTEII